MAKSKSYTINEGIDESKPLYKIVGENIRERYSTGNGKARKFETCVDLWNKFEEYCEYVDTNPIIGEEVKAQGKTLVRVKTKHKRAYTLEEFCLFAGVGNAYLRQFADKHSSSDDRENFGFLAVIDEMKIVVRKQQFDGAAAGQFKENIIARYMGLADKIINENLNSVPLTKKEILDISRDLEDGY